MTMTATASTTTTERSLTNNSAETTFRYITPEPADLVLLGMDAYPPPSRSSSSALSSSSPPSGPAPRMAP
jgi:hypothetical protein